jgi:chromosome segregation protein
VYLKRLEMLGFKSFAVRTLLEFSPGITAVVGPNGVGKSNVADAVRWVLGEQSMRQLRGKKSDDIIFSGGHGKSALGMAEVSLTIDNSTGWVPSAYSEITVTRRSFRSGENEYLINKQKVRLKDVLLLLAQARIGHDSYTVVGQGLIDAALSLRAEERRGLFEDAAGIRPFQVQRTEADSRMHQTEQNLDRLHDIVSEIKPRLAHLAEQARRAIEFGQLNSEFQHVLLSWYTLQWRRLRNTKERAEAAEQEQAHKVHQLENVLRATDEQRESLRTQWQHLQARIVTARKACAEASEFVQTVERDLAISEERNTSLEQQRSEQRQEEQRLRERLIAAQQHVIDLEEQYDLAEEALDTSAAAMATLEAQVAAAQKNYELDEKHLRTAQSDLMQVQARLGASQTDLGRQQKHLGERNRTLAVRRDTIAQSQQSLRMLETRLVEERASLSTARSEEQQVMRRKQILLRAIADTQQEIERLKAALSDAERQRRIVSDRLNMLKNWRQNLSGYNDGVRALMLAPTGRLTGLIGPVPQLGVAPAGLEIALEAALGPYVQAVIVQTYADACACLDYLLAAKAGKAMLLWLDGKHGQEEVAVMLDTLSQAEEAALNRLLEGMPALRKHVSGLAWRYVQCEQRYLHLFHKMLSGMILVKDLDSAKALLTLLTLSNDPASDDIRFEAVVTLGGEVLHVDGWLSGGSGKDGAQQGLLANERELRELPQQLSDQVVLIDQLNSMFSDVQRSQERRRIEQVALDKELQKVAARINGLNKTLDATQREQERIQTELQLVASVEQQLTAEVAGLEQEIQAAQERVRTHEKSQRELAGLVEQLQTEVEERSSVYRRQQDELGQMRTTLAVKRQEARSLRQQLGTQQAQEQDLKAQLEQHLARMQDAEQRQQILRETITLQRAELEKAQARTLTLTDELHRVEAEASNIDQEVMALEQHTLQQRHVLAELEVSYRSCLLESQKARDAVETLLEQMREEMDVTDPRELVRNIEGFEADLHDDSSVLSEAEETQLRRLRRQVEGLRSRLKVLGGCDPDAPQQYEETRTRCAFLSAQIADMEQAAQHLHSIIEQLDEMMAKQFEITFEAVNTRFREHFTTLFHGGNARLELTTFKGSEDDSSTASNMPSGVEIIVQPPGKKVQDMSLLSGGERALVSAALLFALLEINPPPFCLLDEVDAALDESNVTRFCDILKQLAERTQFIIITHNRVTMTVAQAIYGVSMGGDSVSRLLSLKLEEAAVAGDR